MKSILSKVFIVVGIILILAAILWWAIAVSAMVKLPSDVDVENRYQGEMTWYFNPDPAAFRPLPEGQEVRVGLEMVQRITALAEGFDSSRGLVKETVLYRMGDIEQEPMEFVYALDRGTLENVSDDRAYAWTPQNVVDRGGTYYPFLTFDTSKDETYSVWKSEVGEGVDAEFVSEEEKEKITVYNFKISFEDKPVAEAYVESMGLPREVTLGEVKETLKEAGLDVEAFLALATRVMSAEDMGALNSALQAKIPVEYLWSAEQEFSVDPKTGIPIDVYKSAETLSMRLDTSGLSQLLPVLSKYASDPQLGPAITQLSGLQSQLGAPKKVFSYDYHTTPESIAANAEDARRNTNKINIIKVYVPWALLVIGALFLIGGLLMGEEPVSEEEESEEEAGESA